MTTNQKNLIETSCYWLAILLPICIAMGRGVADTNLTLMAVLFFTLSMLRKNYKPFQERWFLIALLLWLYLLLRSIFSDNILLALKKSLPFIRFPLFALCLQHLVSRHKDANKNIAISLFIAVCFLTIDGYIQYFLGKDLLGHPIWYDGNFYRLTGPFSKVVLGATITVLSIPLLALSVYYISRQQKILASLAFCASVCIIVFLSGERSALIQIIIGITAILTFSKIKNKKILMLIPVLAIAILAVLYNLHWEKVINRQIFSILEIIKDYSNTPYGKLWNAGIAIGLEHLIFGVGPMHFESHCNMITDFCRYHPHNIYIEFFAETGLVGVSLLITLFCTIAQKFLTTYRHKEGFLKALILGVGISIMIKLLPVPTSGFFKNWYAVSLWFMVGWLLCISNTISAVSSRNN